MQHALLRVTGVDVMLSVKQLVGFGAGKGNGQGRFPRTAQQMAYRGEKETVDPSRQAHNKRTPPG